MREGKPSFTAACVAAARGLGGVDPIAVRLLEGPLGALLSATEARSLPVAALNLASLGLVDHLEVRTRAIDQTVRDGVAGGVRQLVVLGAGLDARAWRMGELREVRFFEVDHPSTQSYKRAHVAALPAAAAEVRFVPVDFERDALGDALLRAGHDPSRPTLWLWEGVLPYLELPAMRATLGAIAARSAPGSLIAVTYGTPRGSVLGPALVPVARLGFRVLGEPLVALHTPEQIRRELSTAGFRLQDDASMKEWAERLGAGGRRLLLIDEHLAVAVRDGSPTGSAPV